MEPRLVVDLLLRLGPEQPAMLPELCRWCWEAELDAGRVETLRLLLEELEARSVGLEWHGLRGLAEERCLPLLRMVRLGEPAGRRLGLAVCRLLLTCCRLAPPELLQRAVASCVRELRTYTEQRSGATVSSEYSDIHVVVEVLVNLWPLVLERELDAGELLPLALSTVRIGEDSVAARVAVRLISTLLEQEQLSMRDIWDGVRRWERPGNVSRILLLLTSLSPAGSLDLWTCVEFWKVLQAGLVDADNTTRKRALFLLKRAVDNSGALERDFALEFQNEHDSCPFWWLGEKSKQLVQLWENYILIMETLEENQVHVIRPILPRLRSLMDATVYDGKGNLLFHPSWLLCAYKRMFESENKTVMKEGLFHFLDLNIMKYSIRTQELSDFICGPVMDALSESALYSRSPDQIIGSCPVLAVKLKALLVDYMENIPGEFKADFLTKLMKSVTTKHWCAIPILFISQAVERIPSCKIWGVEGLCALREVLRCTLSNHQVLLRGAAQCSFLKAAMHLTDVKLVTLSDISNFLASIRTEETLSRGTKLWMEVCEWLYSNDGSFRHEDSATDENLNRPVLGAYVYNLVEQYMKVSVSDGEKDSYLPDCFQAQLVARMILLAADVEEHRCAEGAICAGDRNALVCFLQPLLNTLTKLNAHAYLPLLKADKSLQLLLKLLEISVPKHNTTTSEDRVLNDLQSCVISTVEQVLEYIQRRLTSELQTVLDLDRYSLYLAVLSEIVKMLSVDDPRRGSWMRSFISSLTQASIRHLQAANDDKILKLKRQIQVVVAQASLAWVSRMTAQYPELHLDSLDVVKTLGKLVLISPFNHKLEKPSCSNKNNRLLEDGSSVQGWGKISAQYVHDQWVCIYFTLNKSLPLPESAAEKSGEASSHSVENATPILHACIEALNIVPADQVLPVLQCMKILVCKLSRSEESLCVKSLDLAWKAVVDLNNNQQCFWPTLSAFIQIAFDHQLLAIAEQCPIQLKVKEIIGKLLKISETKAGVFNMLITHCCQIWLPSGSASSDSFLSAENHVDLFVEACLFGPIFRKDQRLIQDVHTYVELLGDDCAANKATESENRDDQSVRILAISFLCRLNGSNLLHKNFMENLFIKLLEKDEELRDTKGRYYVNSMMHRLKNRIWQALLVLLPQMDQVFLNAIAQTVFRSALSDNQASVKYLIEWFIILLMQKCPELLDSFWRFFSYNPENSKTSICTFLAALVHVDTMFKNISQKGQYMKKALSVILPWGLNHNFSVRLYALLALRKVWEACLLYEVEGEELKFLEPMIESYLEQIGQKQTTGNAGRNWQRIQDHFFFRKFQPVEDYSLETIFYTFPSLSGVIEDEWIPAWKFSRIMDHYSSSSSINVFNSRNQLRDMKSTDWVQQDKGCCLSDLDQVAEWTDIQKKIMPWKTTIPDKDVELLHQERAAIPGRSSGNGLIVVASLIDKTTNLGGLCRTSEIFGASALVVSNLHCVNDKQFQALSVSAEQWLTVIESLLSIDPVHSYCSIDLLGIPADEESQVVRRGMTVIVSVGTAGALLPLPLGIILVSCTILIVRENPRGSAVSKVRPDQLIDYLQQKKTEGHTIVGVEQTANSQDLAHYSFPDKTVLLLGNEREGIPANLIQHLDICVEIPQYGIIRSLNVHVSGALLMWEYKRQQMMKQCARP